MADRTARLRHGWSALTNAHKDSPLPQAPILPSLTAELPALHFTPLSSPHPPPPTPPKTHSFAGVVKQGLPLPFPPAHPDADPPHAAALSRLHARHPWAHPTLISDVLETLDHDDEAASATLAAMSNDRMERASAAAGAERDLSLQEEHGHTGQERETEDARLGAHVDPAESLSGGYLLDSRISAPTELEWEEDDLYYLCRRDALRLSRASGKHARGAYTAFMNGDHHKAKALSKQAKVERIEAEKLHADAARKILQARNEAASKDLFVLDLHGLHVSEAIAALQHRLEEMEARIANPRYLVEKLNILQGTALRGPVFNKELKVVTGVGSHSHGDGSLPTAIKSFLIQNRYKFEELRPGVMAVHPKFHVLKGM